MIKIDVVKIALRLKRLMEKDLDESIGNAMCVWVIKRVLQYSFMILDVNRDFKDLSQMLHYLHRPVFIHCPLRHLNSDKP